MEILRYVTVGVNWFIQIVTWAIVLEALLSWFLPPYNKVREFLARFTAPFVNPFRKLMSRFTGGMPIDFSPMLAIIALQAVGYFFQMIMIRLIY
ncbi:YggT family protein [Gehongia tenuis]|uniref:YggT family protein n=1 Tax=Gehongia tenuis TaxID=2763655 RepID=A0A926D7C1_9FIRM|nr:YggT family protein [Gehongia tenuis]MBC8532184.1 YggT family protein [Gehongia tenuis]